MFAVHTPIKKTTDAGPQKPPTPTGKARLSGPEHPGSKVRRSIGEWEAGKDLMQKPKLKPLDSSTTSTCRTAAEATTSKSPSQYPSRVAEAKACLLKAKFHLGNSRNMKTEIKEGVIVAVERLYRLVKGAEDEREKNKKEEGKELKEKEPIVAVVEEPKAPPLPTQLTPGREEITSLLSAIAQHSKLVQESSEKMECLKEALEKQEKVIEKATYASVVTESSAPQSIVPKVLHSVVVTSKDEEETGEQVLTRIREAMDAKDGWVKVERVRKGKDRKIIIGCKNIQEREKVKERLQKEEKLLIEEVKNKDPLIIFKDVLEYNTNEDVLKALKNQNPELTERTNLDTEFEIRYRKRARNPHQCHIIARVSPKLWNLLTKAGEVTVDLQKVSVADQSPLIQCSNCLGYGHGRRFCKEATIKCSHCGGPHLKTECESWKANELPKCCNCTLAKQDKADHSAFSRDCPVRRKWDTLARQMVAYC